MGSEKFQERLAKAKNYVYRLLGYRARSCQEVRERLKKKGFSKKIIDRVVVELKELDYLNDAEFSSTWVDMKLSTSPCGKRLIEQELRRKGIDEEIIRDATERGYSERDEGEIAYNLALRRVQKYSDLDDKKKWQRLYNFLARRGFLLELVYDVVGRVIGHEKD